MKEHNLISRLGIFFIIAVIIPSIALSLLAIRAIDREEAYMEKQLKQTLLAEVMNVTSMVNLKLQKIQQELNSTASITERDNTGETFPQWKERTPLVGVPFLLSKSHEILWPRTNGKTDTKQESLLEDNRDFFSDRKPVQIYQNIAIAYKDTILDETKKEQSGSEEPALEMKVRSEEISMLAKKKGLETKEIPADGYSYSSQQAITEFDKSEPLRKKVYEEAKEKGLKVFRRKVQLSSSLKSDKLGQIEDQESIFVSEPLKFSEIIAQGDSGIIPRFLNDKLELLFWKKNKGDKIVGCVIARKSFRDMILSALPNIYSPARILTVLDENGTPLITPREKTARDWKRPFVAREISEKLPHWEIAAYLTNPGAISSKAHLVSVIMWLLISILFISIVAGGTLVLKSLHSEIKLAQQKTTFAANVSHELKTPLTSIRMFSEMIKEKRQPDEEKQHKYLDIIVSETERLTRLINNVLDFSRRGQGEKRYNKKKVDIVFLCEDTIESQRIRLEHKGFEVNFITGIEGTMINADEEAIKQALLNLISNAEKYSAEVKKIDIEVTKEENNILINVKDRGIGISPAAAKKVFKEFYRVDDSITSRVSGTGLGLTIARQIIKDHAGEIRCISRKKGGSTFQIRFPI